MLPVAEEEAPSPILTPLPVQKPINVQEELKKGALELKQEVEGFLSMFGGTFSPKFDFNNKSPSPFHPGLSRNVISPLGRAKSPLDKPLIKKKTIKNNQFHSKLIVNLMTTGLLSSKLS